MLHNDDQKQNNKTQHKSCVFLFLFGFVKTRDVTTTDNMLHSEDQKAADKEDDSAIAVAAEGGSDSSCILLT